MTGALASRFQTAARALGLAAAVVVGLALLAACGPDPDAPRERPPVSNVDVETLRTDARLRLIATDDALASLEGAVAVLDSADQATATPRLTALRDRRITLQRRLDSLDASRFASAEAFAEGRTALLESLDGLDRAIARDRVLIAPDARAMIAAIEPALSEAEARAARLRADSTAEGLRRAADLDTMRVRLAASLGQAGRPRVRFDSLRDVLAVAAADLRLALGDTLRRPAPAEPDSL